MSICQAHELPLRCSILLCDQFVSDIFAPEPTCVNLGRWCACRFEQLALEYDSDDLGDLDEQLDGGNASLDDFDSLLSECLAEQRSSQYVNAGAKEDHGSSPASRPTLYTRQQDDAPHVAVAKVPPFPNTRECWRDTPPLKCMKSRLRSQVTACRLRSWL